MKKYKFGIIGPGRIAAKFADALKTVSNAELFAVASRDESKAKDFAKTHGANKYYTRYEDLAADRDIDAVYVATPHPFHRPHAILCLNHKKAVLCEKPLTLSRSQADEVIAAAKKNKVFLMEAMWTRFIPAIVEVKRLIDQKEIGDLRFVQADFGFVAPGNLDHRVYNMQLGGGAQLDVGIYPMFLALLLLGRPSEIKAVAIKSPTGSDASTSATMKFDTGALAQIFSSVETDSLKDGVLLGTKGSITIHRPWHKSMSFTIRKGEQVETQEFPYESNGLQFQVVEMLRCLDAGLIESPHLPWSMSELMADVADEILKQCHVSYPPQT